jgi:ankyrin repeat protein
MDKPNKERVHAKYALNLKVYNDEDDEDCSICLDTPKTVVCIPCGHLCCCYDCFKKLPKTQCVLCRKPIEDIKLSMSHSSLVKRIKEDKRILEIFNIEIPYIQLCGITIYDALSELLELTHSYSNAKNIKAMITAYLNSIEENVNVLDLIDRCTLRRTVKYKVLTATLPKLWLNHYISLYSDDIRSSIEKDDVGKLRQILRENVSYEIFDVLFADGDTPLHLAIKHKSYRCMALLVNAELELMDPVEDETFGSYSSFTRVRNSNGLKRGGCAEYEHNAQV